MLTIYGIKNCDTVKKALNWLDEHNVHYHFHDYKKEGVSANRLQEFIQKFGLENVLNSKSRVFKQLDDSKKPKNTAEAIQLMQQQTSIIKRPILLGDSLQILGFDVDEYQKNLKNLK